MKVSLSCCIAILFARITLACGINWSEPRCKIEGCNEQGYVLITEKLAELNIPGESEAIPLWATFDSSRRTASPYIGMGWRIPFLECSLVQLSEDEFQLTEPGGWKLLFRRAGKGSSILNGGGGWKGQLSTDNASLWADCGWKIELHKGKIVQMKTPHGQTIFYNYTNGRIASVTCGLKTLISVDAKEGPDHTFSMVVEGKRCLIAMANQPQVQSIAGANVIGGNDLSFYRLSGADRRTRSFNYSVDDQTRPTLTITDAAKQETTVSWDPETRRIFRYGDWRYDVNPGKTPLDNAAIGRSNTQKQKEFWFYDQANGRETILQPDGLNRISTWFTSGVAAGKLRAIETYSDNGKQIEVTTFTYDEGGKPLREITKNLTTKEKIQNIVHYLYIPLKQTDSIEIIDNDITYTFDPKTGFITCSQ